MTQIPILSVSTVVMPYDHPKKCVDAVMQLFPDWQVENIPEPGSFPIDRESQEFISSTCAPDTFIEVLKEQRILDTAMDAMSVHLHENKTYFHISRQAAMVKKISFVLENEMTIGGSICVHMEGEGLVDWLQDVTWHPGRRDVPREIGDDLRMLEDGSVQEWYDNKGRPTMNVED